MKKYTIQYTNKSALAFWSRLANCFSSSSFRSAFSITSIITSSCFKIWKELKFILVSNICYLTYLQKYYPGNYLFYNWYKLKPVHAWMKIEYKLFLTKKTKTSIVHRNKLNFLNKLNYKKYMVKFLPVPRLWSWDPRCSISGIDRGLQRGSGCQLSAPASCTSWTAPSAACCKPSISTESWKI